MMPDSIVSQSNIEEVKQSFDLVKFKNVKKQYKINSIDDLNHLPKFTITEELHRNILKTVLLGFLKRENYYSENEVQELGFSDSNDTVNVFRSETGLVFLLHLLFMLETDPPNINLSNSKTLILKIQQISETLVNFTKNNKISSLPLFFTLFSAAVHYFLDKDRIDDQELSNFQELLNKRTYQKINNLIRS